MEDDFLGPRSRGKFPEATEHLKGLFFPTEYFKQKFVFHSSKPSLIPVSGLRGRFPLMELIRTMFKCESGAKFTSPEFFVPFA